MKTTDEIFEEMCADYGSATGVTLNEGCDMAVRLYAAAAQINSLYVYNDWVMIQCFPQTATGDYLDYHAQMRGITRNAATEANGYIRFSVSEASDLEILVSEGTVCMTASGQTFETTANAVIEQGNLYCDAPAQAQETGVSGNVAEGTITYMTAAPVGVSACTNTAHFAGGAAAESDDSLRERVLAGYTKLPNGANAAYYEKIVGDMDDVSAVRVVPKSRGLGTVDIIVASTSGIPSDDLLNSISAALDSTREICVDIEVLAPDTVTVNVTASIDIDDDYAFSDVQDAVESAMQSYFTGEILGEDLLRAKLGDIIYGAAGVTNYRIIAPAADISVNNDELAVLGTLSINAWS